VGSVHIALIGLAYLCIIGALLIVGLLKLRKGRGAGGRSRTAGKRAAISARPCGVYRRPLGLGSSLGDAIFAAGTIKFFHLFKMFGPVRPYGWMRELS